ncbi:MAG: hypothetical protein IJ842_05580 [Bacilli bacterium]|nr:hypothetical protein [Bacilli bacterium]
MKKLFSAIIVLLLTLSVNVYAEDYNILVDENNNFTLKDSSNNQVTDNSIAKYENSVLTLGENTTFNEIKTKHDLTITSNDKEVSIKTLTTKEGNNYISSNINLNKLKVKNDTNYYFKVDVGGNLIILESDISFNTGWEIKGYLELKSSSLKKESESNCTIYTNNRNSEGYAVKIIKSNVKIINTDIYEILLDNNPSGLYIDNSKIEIDDMYSNGKLFINDSEIIAKYICKQQAGADPVTIKNSKIYSRGQIASHSASDEQIFIIENSEIESGEIYGSKAGILITNSSIKSTSNIFCGKNLTIKKSNLELKQGIWNSTETGILIIEDSVLNTQDGIIAGKQQAPVDTDIAIIKNSNITTDRINDFYGKATFINTTFEMKNGIYSSGEVSFNNCSGTIYGNVSAFKKNLNIKETMITFEKKESNYPAATFEEDLVINNSNVIFNHKVNNYPILLLGSLILDDRIVPIDEEKTVLKTRKMTQEEKDNYTFPFGFPKDTEKPIKVFAYENDTFSDYAKLATLKTISFRVKNGTWLDGTKDDIKLDYLYGEKIEVDSLPEEVKKLLTSKMGEWSVDLNNLDPTKDQQIEFRYNIINPETARNYIILIFVTLTVVLLLKRQRKLVNR